VATPILGLDLFRKFQLSIHPLKAQVLDKDQRPIEFEIRLADDERWYKVEGVREKEQKIKERKIGNEEDEGKGEYSK
jgi:hypothetical protein